MFEAWGCDPFGVARGRSIVAARRERSNAVVRTMVRTIAGTAGCEILPPRGMPGLPNGLTLPSDVRAFYELAGGARLFPAEPFGIEIVAPNEFVRANPIIVGEPCEYDISFNWFVVAKSEPQYVTIDLGPDRMGRCYDSFVDRHAARGDCAVVAISFSDLLRRLIEAKGKQLFWLGDGFQRIGDAYDGVAE